MAKTRSPNYPAIGLPDAIKRARMVWEKERHGKMSQEVAVKHMGYNTLNGASMGVVSALRKFGLLDGDGTALKLSQDAMTILHDSADKPERKAALRRVALTPALFREFFEEFGDNVPSEENLRSHLLKRGFIPSAASSANRAYRETMALVEEQAGGYNGAVDVEPSASTGGPPMQVQSSVSSPTSGAPTPAPQVSLIGGDGLPPVSFPLPRGNAIEIRLRSKVTTAEFEQLKKLFDLLQLSVVED